jgi:hypothetical protein
MEYEEIIYELKRLAEEALPVSKDLAQEIASLVWEYDIPPWDTNNKLNPFHIRFDYGSGYFLERKFNTEAELYEYLMGHPRINSWKRIY